MYQMLNLVLIATLPLTISTTQSLHLNNECEFAILVLYCAFPPANYPIHSSPHTKHISRVFSVLVHPIKALKKWHYLIWSCVVSMVTLADTSWGAWRPISEPLLVLPSSGTTSRSAPPLPPRLEEGVQGVEAAVADRLDDSDDDVATWKVQYVAIWIHGWLLFLLDYSHHIWNAYWIIKRM